MAKAKKHKNNDESKDGGNSAERIFQKIIDNAFGEKPCITTLKWPSEQYPLIIIVNMGKETSQGKEKDSIFSANRLLQGEN